MPWVTTIAASAVGEDGLASAQAGKLWIALYRVDDKYFATSAICSHGQASLADGYLDGFDIECPLHQGTFDIRSGEATAAPCTTPIRVFRVRVDDNVIMVEVAEDEV